MNSSLQSSGQGWRLPGRFTGVSHLPGIVLAALIFFHPRPVTAQSEDAISREVSVFDFSLPSANNEAISREVSVFNFSLPSANVEAISREVSVFNNSLPSASTEAISREVSIFNNSIPSANVEAISREVTVFNFGLPSAHTEAISREMSVYNYGVPPVSLAVGSTNIFGNQSNQVPITIQTVLDLTNLSLTLLSDDSHLQILGLTPVAPEVLALTNGTTSANTHPFSFQLNPAAIPATNHILAYLMFQGITNLDSAVVPLIVTNLGALRTSGQFAPGVASSGRVIIIVTRPILFPILKQPSMFTMYGVPGTNYSIQATTNLLPANWVQVQSLLETGATLTVTGLPTNSPQQFFRATAP